DVFTFSETGGGIGVGTTEGQDGAADAALSVGILPAEAGSFAGIVITGGEGTTDASEGVYLRFLFRPTTVTSANLPLTLEINLHEDPNGDGTYDGGTEDEYQAIYHVDTGEGYSEVLIPLASFSDDNSVFAGADDGFDFSSLFEIVIAIGSPTGPEFAFAIDDVGFYDTAATTPVSVEPGSELPASYTLTNAYPNPFNPQTQFELTLVRPQHVRVEVFDLLGRQMALLHEGLLAPQTRHTFQIDASGWPSGLYLYRVTGEAFTDVRSIVLLK
ncbi:MAG: T9SS type A sorting domain-containing protein, partial [Rhodothermales bacterium]|nr:T9SS type A sorting domain-containing protein [Rhodothermales bacterium]